MISSKNLHKIIIIILIIFILSQDLISNIKYLQNDLSNYIHILPKTNSRGDRIPTLNEIFNSRELYINNANLTENYIQFIKPTKEDDYKGRHFENIILDDEKILLKKKDQYDYKEFFKLCNENKLIYKNIKYENKPIISVILSAYNKEKELLPSIRSIQNQNLENIEIIIVDDCSKDNSSFIYNYLLETDPRIRIFHHEKNLGLYRTRLNGFLYSRAKYIIFFDTGDLYEDNYILSDLLYLITKYKLDSIKCLFRFIKSSETYFESKVKYFTNISEIVYGVENIEKVNKEVFKYSSNIWNRLTRADIFAKGLGLLNNKLLNIYKNMWEDIWYNAIINKVSHNFLIIKRVGYVYIKDGLGYGTPKIFTEKQRDTAIQEFIDLLYFDYCLSLKKNEQIIKRLKKYSSENSTLQLNYFKSNFYKLNDLLYSLINDDFVTNENKIFLNRLLNESKQREINYNKNLKF